MEEKPMDYNKAALEMHESHKGKVGICLLYTSTAVLHRKQRRLHAHCRPGSQRPQQPLHLSLIHI